MNNKITIDWISIFLVPTQKSRGFIVISRLWKPLTLITIDLFCLYIICSFVCLGLLDRFNAHICNGCGNKKHYNNKVLRTLNTTTWSIRNNRGVTVSALPNKRIKNDNTINDKKQ